MRSVRGKILNIVKLMTVSTMQIINVILVGKVVDAFYYLWVVIATAKVILNKKFI